MIPHYVVIIIVILCNCQYAVTLVEIIEPSPSSLIRQYKDSKLKTVPDTFNLVGELVLAEPTDGCSRLNNRDQTEGKIVLMVQTSDDCSAIQRADVASQAKAIGMLILSSGFARGGFGTLYTTQIDRGSVFMPSLNFIDGEELVDELKKNTILRVLMKDTHRNAWLEMAEGPIGITFVTSLGIILMINFSLASYKLYLFIRYKGLQISLATATLFLEALACLVRLLYICNGIAFYSLLTALASNLLLGYGNNLSFMTDLLITFYWHNVLNKADRTIGQVLCLLGKTKIPYIIAVVFLWVIDTLASLSRSFSIIGKEFNTYLVGSGVYAVFEFVIVSFIIVTSIRIFRALSITSDDQVRKQVTKTTRLMVIIALLLTGSLLANIVYLTPMHSIGPVYTIGIWWVWLLCLYTESFVKIHLFITPTRQGSVDVMSGSPVNSQMMTEEDVKSHTSKWKSSSYE